MWLYDIDYDIYSSDHTRKIYVVRHEQKKVEHVVSRASHQYICQDRKREVFTVVEDWHTPESQGNTGDFGYYIFYNPHDAAYFIAWLAMKLNSPLQNALLQSADEIITRITREHNRYYKKAAKLKEAKKSKIKPTPPPPPPPKKKSKKDLPSIEQMKLKNYNKHVYAFDMNNGKIKIGVTNDIPTRKKAHEHSNGTIITRYCYTQMMPNQGALNIETMCLKAFDDRRAPVGELVFASFEEVKTQLQFLANLEFTTE